MKKRLAIIPARGGSKRIPRKNIKSFLGKPIIQYSIEAAIGAGIFDEIMVSTDDEEIAAISRQCGAKIPFMRSAKTADDFATTLDVINEVLKTYETSGFFFDYVCCIYPTAPFTTSDALKKGYFLLKNYQYSSVIPVLKFSFPIQRSLKKTEEGKVSFIFPENVNVRSQDLDATYHDSGQFYWMDTEKIKLEKSLWTDNTGAIVLTDFEAHDIDTLEDWEVAEFKYKLKHEKT